MKIFRGIKKFGKNLAKGLRRGMNIAEDVVNTADKISGGLLRTGVAGLTGGLSEVALAGYKTSKPMIKAGLDVVEGKKTINEGMKYAPKNIQDQYQRAIKPINQATTMIERAKVLQSDKPYIDKALSSNLGRNVLQASDFSRKHFA
jgi:hypothetical protein